MDADALKRKVSREFLDLLCQVRKGHRPDYELLLEEISFIESDNSLTALQYYLNNGR